MKNRKKIELNIKKMGQVFTPSHIVNTILNKIHYTGPKILNKKIMDNSCGSGNFLVKIIDRYCNEFLKINVNTGELKKHLETYIYGVEIDNKLISICKNKLDKVAKKHNLQDVNWKLFLEDATKFTKLNKKMDFVVGNPPYIRIHNMNEAKIDLKEFSFCEKGNSDLYLAFFNIGLNILKKSGTLGYITPNSFLNSNAGKIFRNFILSKKMIIYLKNFEHKQLFKNITSYSAITILKSNNKKEFFEFEDSNNNVFQLKFKNLINRSGFFLCQETNEVLESKRIFEKKTIVKNGFATLNDDFFIRKNSYDKWKNFQLKTLKASTGKWYWCLFPYDKNGKPLTWLQIGKNHHLNKYFLEHKNKLNKPSKDGEWFLFGRHQAVKDVNKHRYAVNSIIKTKFDIKLNELPPNTGVYSGYYIISKLNFPQIKKIVISDRFINFIKGLGFYKNGGYFYFRSKDLEKFINYEIQK